MEHNVAQICGNLWRDPINRDGTPKGWQLFRECGEDFAWTYQSLEMPEARQLRVWGPGTAEDYPASVIAKVWNWDPTGRSYGMRTAATAAPCSASGSTIPTTSPTSTR